MSERTTFLQSLFGFGDELKHYRLQEDLGSLGPLIYFGPVGHINLFVGANNSGKSRFLRALFKNATFTLLSDEEIEHINNLFTRCEELIHIDSKFHFALKVGQGNDRSTSRSDPHFARRDVVPSWVSEVLKYYNNADFNEVYGREYFETVRKQLRVFFKDLFDYTPPANPVDRLKKLDRLNKALKVDVENAQAAKKLLIGEREALKYDMGLRASQNYTQFRSLQRWAQSINMGGSIRLSFKDASEEFQTAFVSFWNSVEILASTKFQTQTPKERIYIPTLRSAVSLRQNNSKVEEDLFQETVCYNYEISREDIEAEKIDVFTGNQLYQAISDDSNGDMASRRRFEDFEKFLGDTFFQGRTVYVIAVSAKHSPGKHIQVEVEGDAARDLHHLGDGIGALVILMYRIFLAKPGSWIFIEEPELNLHPGLQRIFLQTLMYNPALLSRNLRVFMTTHSNHLLNVTLNQVQDEGEEILEETEELRPSVFAFQKRGKNENFQIRALLSEQHEALALLGVSNASVLLAQCGIWVEGFTDRLYVRAYLKAYTESRAWQLAKHTLIPREDLDYAFWDYAGSNLAHYLFTGEEIDDVSGRIRASAVCNRIFLMADRDKKVKRRHAILEAIDSPNFAFYVTPGIEIENLIGAGLLRECLPRVFRAKAKSVEEEIPSLNFTEKDYQYESLGEFLSKRYPKHCPPALKHKERGTLSNPYKILLAQEVAARVNWDNMSPDARRFTKHLYNFIARHASHKVSV